jgi:predicted transglutaminase-like cysteine proteinase
MLLRAVVAASLSLVSAPANPQTAPQQTIPVDTIARAKFPKLSGEAVDWLANLNRTVNHMIQGESDMDHYGVADYWVMLPSDMKGDCEDYQLTKLFLLGQAGFPTVTNAKMVGVIIHQKGRTEGHAILALLLKDGSVAYLDNLNDEIMTRKELVGQGYEFFDWRA